MLKAHNVLSFILPYMEQQALYDQIDFDRDWNSLTGATGRTPNFKVVKSNIPDFLCPTAPARPQTWPSDYAVCVFINESPYCLAEVSGLAATKRDTGTLKGLLDDTPVPIRKVTDGLSKTFLFYEDAGRPLYFVRGQETEDAGASAVSPLSGLSNGSMAPEWSNPSQYFGFGNTTTTGCGLTTVMNCTNWDEIYSFHPGGSMFVYGDGSADFITDSIDFDTFVSLITRDAGDIVKSRN
jgi:hypothetical protein